MAVITYWECLMLAGPLIGNVCIWLFLLWMKNVDPKPQPARRHPSSHVDGPEMVPFGSRKPGSALSDFVKAMREEDGAQSRTSALTPGVPTRIHIDSPKTSIPTPLFPLSAPLTDETCTSPPNPHDFASLRQINGSIDISMTKTARSPINVTSTANLLGEEENSSNQSAQSPPSYSELLDEANSIPLPQLPINQAISSPSDGRRVRFSPHVRVVSTGAQLFPGNEHNPLSPNIDSPNIDLPRPPVRPMV